MGCNSEPSLESSPFRRAADRHAEPDLCQNSFHRRLIHGHDPESRRRRFQKPTPYYDLSGQPAENRRCPDPLNDRQRVRCIRSDLYRKRSRDLFQETRSPHLSPAEEALRGFHASPELVDSSPVFLASPKTLATRRRLSAETR